MTFFGHYHSITGKKCVNLLFFSNRIENADVLLILIDLKEHISDILAMGLYEFLHKHLKNDLNISFTSFDQWLRGKNVIVSLNKKDLVDANSLDLLEKKLDSPLLVNKISSINSDDKINDIKDLLKQLRKVLGSL